MISVPARYCAIDFDSYTYLSKICGSEEYVCSCKQGLTVGACAPLQMRDISERARCDYSLHLSASQFIKDTHVL